MSESRLSQLSDPKILLVRNDGLGDFVLTLPLVASLKAQLPTARIYGLVNHRLAGLMPLLPDFEGAILDQDVLLKRHHGVWSAAEVKQKPAVPIKKSVMPDHIVCLEDGKKLKMLKRYLRSNYDMTPDDYRAKWGLAADYPMVAPNYAAPRSAFAKKIGLGRKGRAARGRKK